MNVCVLLLAVLVCLSQALPLDSYDQPISESFARSHDYRLLKFNETYERWFSPQELGNSELVHRKYMDITDFPDMDSSSFVTALDPIPNRPSKPLLVMPLIDEVRTQNLVDVVKKLSSFKTRKYDTPEGLEAAHFIRDYFQSIIDASNRSDVSVSLFEHVWDQPSVIARIEGNGPNKDQLVIISAHEDSISRDPNGFAPGADDDASGTSCVMEVFRVLVASGFKPSRTVEFHTYAAEEVGLLGSQAVVNNYKVSNKLVHAHLQLDMTMYTRRPDELVVMTDYTDKDLTFFVTRIISDYVKKRVVLSKCGYACSDHASWNRAGYRTVMPAETLFEETNPNIHTENDVFENLNPSHGRNYAITAMAFIVELA